MLANNFGTRKFTGASEKSISPTYSTRIFLYLEYSLEGADQYIEKTLGKTQNSGTELGTEPANQSK